jgi:hypothetical protein
MENIMASVCFNGLMAALTKVNGETAEKMVRENLKG